MSMAWLLFGGAPFYLAVVRSWVSVRGLHTCPKVHWRVTSGFFAHWRISEWETDVRGQMHTAHTGRCTSKHGAGAA